MDTLDKRVSDDVNALEGFVNSAEAVASASTEQKAWSRAFGRLVEVLNDDTLATALDQEGAAVLVSVQDGAKFLLSSLTVSTDVDRAAGDDVVDRMNAYSRIGAWDIIKGGDEVKVKVVDLVARWTVSRGVNRSASGVHASPSLGFKVEVGCDVCEWSARTSKDNVNSIRHQAISHAKVHGREMKAGTEGHTGITEALKAVMTGGVVAGQGGGFIVKRV